MSYPSDKYKQSLLQVKKDLMKEISSYLKDGLFKFKETRVLSKKTIFGSFEARFDTISGDEYYLKLYRKETPFMIATDFKNTNRGTVELEIPFLMELLDTIEYHTK